MYSVNTQIEITQDNGEDRETRDLRIDNFKIISSSLLIMFSVLNLCLQFLSGSKEVSENLMFQHMSRSYVI